MSDDSGKYYSIAIKCESEQEAKEVARNMNNLMSNTAVLWFVIRIAERWYTHTSHEDLDAALLIYRLASKHYEWVSLYRGLLEMIDVSP